MIIRLIVSVSFDVAVPDVGQTVPAFCKFLQEIFTGTIQSMRSPDSAPRPKPRRDALLRATMEVVAERGVAGVTHRAVTERAGVPLTTASYYFPSIDELVFAALRRFAEERTEKLHKLLATVAPLNTPTGLAAPPKEAIRALLAELTNLPRWERMAFFEILCNAPRAPQIAEPARAAVDCYLQTVRDAMTALGFSEDSPDGEAGKPSGDLSGNPDGEAGKPSGDLSGNSQARAVVALGIGYGVLRLAHPDFDDADWLLESIWDLLNRQT
jgi:AcrR family transcriptional regulator